MSIDATDRDFIPRITVRDHKDMHLLQRAVELSIDTFIASGDYLSEAAQASQDRAFIPHIQYVTERLRDLLELRRALHEAHMRIVDMEGEKSFMPTEHLPPLPGVLLPTEKPSPN